jgi:hypothetical protein
MTAVPPAVWQRWSRPDYDLLRQAVLIFGGDPRTEAALEQFRDVSLLYQAGEGTSSLTGVFCLTTKRFVFLPHFELPHPRLVQSRFASLKSLSGTRSDLTVTITDQSGSTVNFQFQSKTALFMAFNLLRVLCEGSRKDEGTFCQIISQITTQQSLDDSSFSSIEVELPPCESSHDITESTTSTAPVIIPPAAETGIGEFQLRVLFDYFNSLHFDIHVKLRALFVVSTISFVLHFIPFLPLLAFTATIYSLWRAWTYSDQEPAESAVREYAAVRNFFDDWLGWRNHDKSVALLRGSASVYLLYMILTTKWYYTGFAVAYFLLVIRPLYRHGVFRDILTGFWFCT